MRDLLNNVNPVRALDPVVGAASDVAQVSEIIDMQGFKSLVWLIALGILADADATFTVLMEHGNDSGLSDAAAVPDSQLDPTEAIVGFDFADDSQVRKIGYVGEKRFVRLTITPAANAGTWPVAIIALQGNADGLPTTPQVD